MEIKFKNGCSQLLQKGRFKSTYHDKQCWIPPPLLGQHLACTCTVSEAADLNTEVHRQMCRFSATKGLVLQAI